MRLDKGEIALVRNVHTGEIRLVEGNLSGFVAIPRDFVETVTTRSELIEKSSIALVDALLDVKNVLGLPCLCEHDQLHDDECARVRELVSKIRFLAEGA